MKLAIYARVSTVVQDYAMQVNELREFADRSKWTVVEYSDKASGKANSRRPGLDQLMADASLRKFDAVAVWKLDRFGRSLSRLIDNIRLLDSWGIRFMCPGMGIDTDKRSPMGTFIVHLFGALAEFERALIIERVQSGVAEYKRAFDAGEVGKTRKSRSGKNLAPHRPKLIFPRDRAVRLRAEGLGWGTIARKLGVSPSTIRRACATLPKAS